MPKVKKQTAGAIGLMAAVLYIIGNVVGLGIFFKNMTVFRLNVNNCWGVLLSWVVSMVIVFCMALSFAEISTCKMKNKNAGLGGWSSHFCGHKFGRYAKTGYTLVFWPLNTFSVLFFGGEAILKCFAPLLGNKYWTSMTYDYGTGTSAYVFLIGLVLFVMFALLNYAKTKAMTKAGSVISFVKFAPIAMTVILGIVFGVLYNKAGLWNGNTMQPDTPVGSFSFAAAMTAIPAILFSYEGYISVGNISTEIKNPEKNLSLAVILGVLVISALYFVVTIGCITAGTGNAYDLFIKLGNDTIKHILTMVMSVFILICLIGSINGLTRGGIYAFQAAVEDGDLFKSKAMLNVKPGDKMFAGLIGFGIMILFWWIILAVPSSILNTDALGDGSSTSMIVIIYVIYGVTVAGGLVNRKTKKIEVHKIKLFPVTAVIGILGCIFMVGYVAIYQMTIAPILAGLDNLNSGLTVKAGWGMFVQSQNCLGFFNNFKNWEVLMWFWIMTGIAALSPIVNDLLIKGFDKSNKTPLIWQKANPKLALK